MAELELELELLTKEAAKDLQKFAKSFEKFAKEIEKNKIVPKIDGKAAKKQLSAIEKQAQEFRKNTSSAFAGVTKSAGRLGPALAAVAVAAVGAAVAFRKLVDIGSQAVEAAAVQEQAVTDLNNALKLAGNFTNAASFEMQAFAAQMEATTRIGDETVLQMLALAQSFDLSTSESKKLVAAAADLAQETGISLESAVRNLGKSYSGLAGELGELIPEITNMTEEQRKAGGVVDFVANRFDGAAAAATNTYAGAIDQLTNAWGSLLEAFGSFVTENPLVIKGIKGTRDGLQDLANFIIKNKNNAFDFLIESFAKIADTIPVLVKTLDLLLKPLAAPIVIFAKAAEGALAFAEALATLAQTNQLFTGFSDFLRDEFQSVLDVIKSAIDKFNELRTVAGIEIPLPAGLEAGLAGLELTLDGLKTGAEETAEVIDAELLESIKSGINSTRNGLAGFSDFLIEGLDGVAQSAIGLGDEIRELGKTSKKTGKDISDAFVGPEIPRGILQERRAAEARAAAAPAATASFGDLDLGIFEKVGDIFAAAGSAFATNVLKGADGAGKAVSQLGGAVTDIFLPGFGGAVAGFLDMLIQLGPEGVVAMVEGFVEQLPVVFETLSEALPAVILAIAENADKIIAAIIIGIPKIIEALVRASPAIAMAIVESLWNLILGIGPGLASVFRFWASEVFGSLVDNITSFNFAEVLAQGIADATSELKDAFSSLVEAHQKVTNALFDFLDGINRALGGGDKGTGTGGSDIERALGFEARGIFGAAKGGLVGGSGNRDSELFRLQPGELVTSDNTTQQLQDFLNAQQGPGETGGQMSVLVQILDALKQPMTVQTSAELNGQTLADIILSLNRANSRLGA